MKKIIYIFIFLFTLTFGVNSVSASTFYVNANGVEFTRQQYEYITDLYYDGYQDTMTQNELDKMIDLNLFKQSIVSVEDNNMLSGNNYAINNSTVTQNGVTTKITKSCTTECLVVLKSTWALIPTINSYDVIGFRLSNASIDTINKATITGTNYSVTYQPSTAQQFNNGFGYSIKLGNVMGMKITTSMYTSTSGKVYGSYQHANSNVSLATSQLYTIGAGGYGNVFNFYGDALFKYNNAVGVDITL